MHTSIQQLRCARRGAGLRQNGRHETHHRRKFLSSCSSQLFRSHLTQGRAVVEVLGAKKPGQWTGKVLSTVIDRQLEYPDGTKEQCAEWLKGEHASGRVSIVDEPSTVSGKRGKGGDKETVSKKLKQ